MKADEPLVLLVELNPRQQRQLIAVSDTLNVPMHEVGKHAIVAFLGMHGQHARGREKQAVRRIKKAKR